MTEKVDVFSFGVVALEIVAGESNYQNSHEENTTYIFERVIRMSFIPTYYTFCFATLLFVNIFFEK